MENEKGFALVFVLWVLIFLTVAVGAFSYSVRQNASRAYYFGIQAKAEYIARAGIQRGLSGLAYTRSKNKETRWRINADIPEQTFQEGTYRITISNESGRVNLNKADASLLRMILNPLDMEDAQRDVIVDSIMDWRDPDQLHRLNGAEDKYYKSLPTPYAIRDGNFRSKGELLKVRGITPEIYEAIKNVVSVKVDENKLLPEKSDIQEYLQLENRGPSNSIQTFLTLEKRREMNRQGDLYDYSKINVNAASPFMLMALPGMDIKKVTKIMEFRSEADFKSLTEFENIIGPNIYAGLKKYVSLDLSRYYTLSAVGKVADTELEIRRSVDIWLDDKKCDILQRYGG